jgi:acyl transferase domain-containing protein/acyl carrier protein
MTEPKNTDFREQFRRSLAKIAELKAAVADLEAEKSEPIAIVGMACRFPGAETPEEFWRVVEQGEDHIRRIPDDRIIESWPTDVPRWAGVLDRVDMFDPEFFGISPREAVTLDPQQRLVLEVAWESLERACLVPGALSGSRTGVFLGYCANDYGRRIERQPADQRDAYGLTGNMASTAAGRVAYVFGLQGPTVTVDTACSSSLVAIHLACASLRNRESDLALAGGVNMILAEQSSVALSHAQALSPNGRCRTFDAAANGFVRGEGCGFVVLERLSDARRNGRPILAIVSGSAVNQDGRSTGLTAPNVLSQQSLLREALQRARIAAEQVAYLECHGTGTTLGDPIEVEAIRAVLGMAGSSPLWLGAVKTNIGHLEGAAGIAGLIKVVLALRHGRLPRILNLRHLNPRLPLQGSRLVPLTQNVEWPRTSQARTAGVSGFGMSGTNAHVILAEAPEDSRAARVHADVKVPWVVSGRSASAVEDQQRRLREWLAGAPEVDVVDVGFTLATARTHFEWRAARVGEASTSAIRVERHPKLAVLFTGQGSQRPGMGRELLEAYPVFRAAFEQVCQHFDPLLPQPLASVMFADEGARLDQTTYTQPALFALEVALYRLYESWGVRPEILLGHSIGEIVAAHVAGVFDLPDACRLVAARGRLMQALPEGGAMVSVQASEAETLAVLGRFEGVDIAGINGPLSTVVSGDEQPVLALARHFEELGRRTTRLIVSHAFHSRRMEPMLAAFREVVASLRMSAPKLAVVSNVTGTLATAQELCSPDYWVRHVRDAVRFFDGVRTLEAQGATLLLELGPHAVLTAMAAGCLSEAGQKRTLAVSSLRRDREERETLALALGSLHCHGLAVDWAKYFEPWNPRLVELPTYAFQRQRYWLDLPKSKPSDPRAAGLEAIEHPLLGAVVPLAHEGGWVFTARLSTNEQPWIADHVVFEHVLFPGTGFLDLALAAANHIGAARVEELTIAAPLVLRPETSCALQLTIAPADPAGRRRLEIHSRFDELPEWTLHAQGSVGPANTTPDFELSVWPPAGATEIDLEGLYDRLARKGLHYGPVFRGLRRAWRAGDVRFAEVRLPEGSESAGFAIHPALLDASLHALASELGEDVVALPFAWSGVALQATGASAVRVRFSPGAGVDGQRIEVADASGRPVLHVEGLNARTATPETIRAGLVARRHESLYRLEWRAWNEDERPSATTIVVGDAMPGMERAETLAQALERSPRVVVMIADQGQGPLEATIAMVESLRQWLSDERSGRTRLVVVTRRAVAAGDEDVLDLDRAPLWGLIRAVRNEHAEREFGLVDVDDAPASRERLRIATNSTEPELALRNGQFFVPRLARTSTGEPVDLGDGAVLVTGAMGALGQLVTRHLARRGVRHFVLISRQGPAAAGAAELIGELEAVGATVQAVACDVGDREALARVVAGVREPLVAVVHTAGVLADGTLESLAHEDFEKVFRAKVDAARHLDESTRDQPLRAFVLFSSVAGILGSAGQSNYAAANAHLDALCARRRAHGLPGVSLAWGPWEEAGMAARLSDVDRRRLARNGMRSLSTERALALFDGALTSTSASLVPIDLDLDALAKRDDLPSLMRELVRSGPRRATSTESEVSFARQFAAIHPAERTAFLIDVVTREVRAVTGGVVEPDTQLRDLGIDSLMAVEVRNRLRQLTEIELPSTLLFEFPTVQAIAAKLLAELGPQETEERAPEGQRDSRARMFESLKVRKDAIGRSSGKNDTAWLFRALHSAILADDKATATQMIDLFVKLRGIAGELRTAEARPIPLTRATEEPPIDLYCLPTPAVPSTPLQFVQLAEVVRGKATVWAAANPGYEAGERFAGSHHEITDYHIEGIRTSLAGRSPFLIGFSAGGWLALDVARRLEELGTPARGVIMFDTIVGTRTLRSDIAAQLFFVRSVVESLLEGSFVYSESELAHQLAAMRVTFGFYGDWDVPVLDVTPVLYLRATGMPLGDGVVIHSDPEGELGPKIASLEIVPIDADHFEILAEAVGKTIDVVSRWTRAKCS